VKAEKENKHKSSSSTKPKLQRASTASLANTSTVKSVPKPVNTLPAPIKQLAAKAASGNTLQAGKKTVLGAQAGTGVLLKKPKVKSSLPKGNLPTQDLALQTTKKPSTTVSKTAIQQPKQMAVTLPAVPKLPASPKVTKSIG